MGGWKEERAYLCESAGKKVTGEVSLLQVVVIA